MGLASQRAWAKRPYHQPRSFGNLHSYQQPNTCYGLYVLMRWVKYQSFDHFRSQESDFLFRIWRILQTIAESAVRIRFSKGVKNESNTKSQFLCLPGIEPVRFTGGRDAGGLGNRTGKQSFVWTWDYRVYV